MKKGYALPIFPTNGIIFLDTSAFGLDDYKLQYTSQKNRFYSISYLKKNTSRLLNLKDLLLNSDNWLIIKEVKEEFINGNEFFKEIMKKIRDRNTKSAIKNLLRQRKKILELISQEYVIADNNLVPELKDRIDRIYPKVEKTFNRYKGKTNEKKTDIKLISLALAYAWSDYSAIFSQDQALLKTFADCAREQYLFKKSFIISDRFKTKIPTQAYNQEFKRIKLEKIANIPYSKSQHNSLLQTFQQQ